MKDNIQVLCHSSIKITGSKTIYVDPYNITENYKDADYIFCTHSHYDHFSPEDIERVIKKDTTIITVETSRKEALKIVDEEYLLIVEPYNNYKIGDIEFSTTYSYNINKAFHPKENKWVGYIINIDGVSYYIAGDTDNIKEIQNIECDIALLPIGGTYTMDYKEAAELANIIKAKTVIPTHYGTIVGSKEDAKKFKELVKGKTVEIKIK